MMKMGPSLTQRLDAYRTTPRKQRTPQQAARRRVRQRQKSARKRNRR